MSYQSAIHTLVDIDECSSSTTNGCEHFCTNLAGSYECSCEVGYQLDNDAMNCTGQERI